MESITPNHIRQAIADFLQGQYLKKSEKEQKQLEKAREANDTAKIAELTESLRPLQEKYQADNWLKEAEKMARQLNFGTHTSKGIHSDAKGDNIIFTEQPTHGYVGTHSLSSTLLDANGNAAALPLAAFFEQPVTEDCTMRDVILAQLDALQGCFGTDPTLSAHYQTTFYQCLTALPEQPSTHERNKQILWPIDADNDCYHTLVPLYPSVLAHTFYQNINERRWSETAKTARENRKTPTKPQYRYQDLLELATTQLGGTKPQNISLLNSRQGGRHYLLPSLPPIFTGDSIRLPQTAESLFETNLYQRQIQDSLRELTKIITQTTFDGKTVNNKALRDNRDAVLHTMIDTAFMLALALQAQTAGWSKAYKPLDTAQKFWLDPHRDDAKFIKQRQQIDWQNLIAEQFATWLNDALEKRLQKRKDYIKGDLGLPEKQHWQTAFLNTLKDFAE